MAELADRLDQLIADAAAQLDRLVEGVAFTRSHGIPVTVATRGVASGCVQAADADALAALAAVAIVRLAEQGADRA